MKEASSSKSVGDGTEEGEQLSSLWNSVMYTEVIGVKMRSNRESDSRVWYDLTNASKDSRR